MEEMSVNDRQIHKTERTSGGMNISLGKKMSMPYSLKNMQAAYDSLSKENLCSSTKLEATHYYVRFLPKDSAQFAELLGDTTLVLFPTPFDMEIEGEGGDFYCDPSLPEGSITWQYTKVPVDYKFPDGIRHEILDELYILPEFEKEKDKNALRSESFQQKLEYAAFLTAGYIEKEETDNKPVPLRSLFSSIVSAIGRAIDPTWTPKANIMAYDDLLQRYIPLKNVKVWINHGGVWYSRNTDSNGYAKFPKCIGPVIYIIEWADSYWQIFDGYILPAYYIGGTKRSTWNLNMIGGKSLHYACIHRALQRHMYGNNLDITRPYYLRHKIVYLDSDGTGTYLANFSGTSGGWFPDVLIYGKDSKGNRKSTTTLLGTALHEMGHASHCLGVGYDVYWGTNEHIYESWADAVEWALLRQEYTELWADKNMMDRIRDSYGNQDWPNKDDKAYSSLFIDLMDDYNQRIKNEYFDISLPNDNVSGYTLKTLNSSLKYFRGLPSTSNYIKKYIAKPAGVTDAKLDELFKKYDEIW